MTIAAQEPLLLLIQILVGEMESQLAKIVFVQKKSNVQGLIIFLQSAGHLMLAGEQFVQIDNLLRKKMGKKKVEILGNPSAKWCDINCPNLIDSKDGSKKFCKVASDAQGWSVETKAYYCSICLSTPNSKKIGNKGIQIATRKASQDKGLEAVMSVEERLGEGTGSELHKMIPSFIESKQCGCKAWAKKMNIWGPEKCEAKREEIVDKLVSESKKRAIFSWVPESATRIVAHNLLTAAIKRAKDKLAKDNWTVVVTTAPRVDPTLSVCLDSLLIAGWNAKIFAEPGNYDYLNAEYQSNVIFNSKKRGVWWNWVDSCRWALENTTAENIMTVQDDSLFHPDSKVLTEKFLWPREDAGFISLYTPKHYSVRGHLKSKPPRPFGLNRIATKSLWGACALVFPRSVLEEMMNDPFIGKWRGASLKTKSAWKKKCEERSENPWMIANSDTAIGKMMNKMGKSMWFMDPSPVQHIAEHSAMGHGGNKGRRNCGRCAKYSMPLEDQVPFHISGMPPESVIEYKNLKK